MLPSLTLPATWRGLLEMFRPVFQRGRGTFVVFTVLATGMVAATGRRSVVGMLAGRGWPSRSPSTPRAGSSPRAVGHRPDGAGRGPADRDPAARAG